MMNLLQIRIQRTQNVVSSKWAVLALSSFLALQGCISDGGDDNEEDASSSSVAVSSSSTTQTQSSSSNDEDIESSSSSVSSSSAIALSSSTVVEVVASSSSGITTEVNCEQLAMQKANLEFEYQACMEAGPGPIAIPLEVEFLKKVVLEQQPCAGIAMELESVSSELNQSCATTSSSSSVVIVVPSSSSAVAVSSSSTGLSCTELEQAKIQLGIQYNACINQNQQPIIIAEPIYTVKKSVAAVFNPCQGISTQLAQVQEQFNEQCIASSSSTASSSSAQVIIEQPIYPVEPIYPVDPINPIYPYPINPPKIPITDPVLIK